MTNATLSGTPDAGNPHVRLDEGEVASAKPRRGSLLYNLLLMAVLVFAATSPISVGAATPVSVPKTAVLCDTPFGVIYEGDQAVMRLQYGASASNLYWRLEDWRGNKVRQGVWPTNGALALAGLPAGHYELTPRYGDGRELRAATITVVERMAAPLPRDSYLAIMTAFAYTTSVQGDGLGKGRGDFTWYDGSGMLANADALEKLGINFTRELFLWGSEERQRGKPALQAKERKSIDALRKRGIMIDAFNQTTPSWALPKDAVISGRSIERALTRDYKALYDYYKWLADTLGEDAVNIEHWNEEDGVGNEPAWEYAATMKAAYLGIKAAKKNHLVLQGSFCCKPIDNYHRVVMANDIARYSDVFNYHSYCPNVTVPDFMAKVRKIIEEAGCPNRAIWITEVGPSQEGLCDVPSVRAKNMQYSREQELIVTEWIVKEMIQRRMYGVAKHFRYLFGVANERGGVKTWGLLRRDGSVTRGYAATATAVRRLGHAKLEGRVDLGDRQLDGYLFTQPDGSQTLVLWVKSALDTTDKKVHVESDLSRQFVLRAPVAGEVAVYDVCGARRNERFEDGRLLLDLDRYPTIVTGLNGFAAVAKPMPVGKPEPHEFAADEDPTIVIRVDLDKNDFTVGGGKAIAEAQVVNPRATVVVWNLSDQPKRGTLTVENAKFDGLPPQIEVAPWSKVEFTTTMTITSPLAAKEPVKVAINGVFDGRKISQTALFARDVARLYADAIVVQPDLSRLSSWKRNDNANKCEFVWDEDEQALRFDAEWDINRTDRWAYESFSLELPKEQCEGVIAIEFEVKLRQDKVENDINWSYVYVNSRDATGKHRKTPYPIYSPRDGWEKRRAAIKATDAQRVIGFQFGCNPRGRQLSYWVRNLKVFKLSGD